MTLTRHSPRDAAKYDDFNAAMARVAAFVKPLLTMLPPDPQRPGLRGTLQLAGLARRYRQLSATDQSRFVQMMSMSAVDNSTTFE